MTPHPLLRARANRARWSPLLSGALAVGLVALSACRGFGPPPPEAVGLWPDAAGATRDRDLAELFTEAWEAHLRAHPELASDIGDPRFHGRLEDISEAGRAARRDELWSFQRRLDLIPVATLDEEDRRNAELFRFELARELTELELRLDEWAVDPLSGPQVRFPNLAVDQPVGTVREREQLVSRWSAIPEYLRRLGEAHQRSLAAGRVATAGAIHKAIDQIDRLLATPPLLSSFVEPVAGGGRLVPLASDDTLAAVADRELGDSREQERLRTINRHVMSGEIRALGTHVLVPPDDDPLSPEERGRFLERTRALVADEIYPAFAAYRSVLRDELLPAARSELKPGLAWVYPADNPYAEVARLHVGQTIDPTEVHLEGLTEVERIREQMLALGSDMYGSRSLLELRVALERDPQLRYADDEQIVAEARAALARAELRVGRALAHLPAASCEVLPIPAHEAPESTVAYYRQPIPDLGRPGRYYVNTHEPANRPRWQAEALAFHEAVPGHHTQIALAQELTELPAFRRYLGSTAFVEGWALYAERLADELGLYSSDLDRLGMLSFDAWRAARLVVDTGLHTEGWTRDEAVRFLRDNTLLAEENIQNEVDRYIVWPGQALAYKLGANEILALRRLAETRLGPDFDLAAFHSELLRHGAVSLPVLRTILTDWIARQA